MTVRTFAAVIHKEYDPYSARAVTISFLAAH
jgi:hypothetical protein